MATQAGIYRLRNILRYLQQQANDTPRLGDRLFAVTDAAVIVNARLSGLILEQQYPLGTSHLAVTGNKR